MTNQIMKAIVQISQECRPNFQYIQPKLKDMCGRIFQTLPLHRLLQIARAKKCTNQQQHTSSFNVCPTTYIPVIKPNRFYMQQHKEEQLKDQQLQNEDCRQLTYMKWGHKSNYNMIINGRIEELLSKRVFVDIIKNRCVVIMEGYFQWNQKKQPFSLRPKQGDHFLVAGLYTDENQIIILTKDATPQLSKVHNRMPVILSHEQVNVWMNPKNTKDIQNIIHKSLLKKDKEVWKNVGFAKIAPYVSNLKEKSVKCLMTIEEYKKQLDKTGLMRFWKKAPAVEAVEAPPNEQKNEPSSPLVKEKATKYDPERAQKKDNGEQKQHIQQMAEEKVQKQEKPKLPQPQDKKE